MIRVHSAGVNPRHWLLTVSCRAPRHVLPLEPSSPSRDHGPLLREQPTTSRSRPPSLKGHWCSWTHATRSLARAFAATCQHSQCQPVDPLRLAKLPPLPPAPPM